MPKLQLTGAERNARLRQMAEILDLPIEAFSADREAEDASDLLNLLRLWSAVTDIQARRRVLSVLRQEAERAGYRE